MNGTNCRRKKEKEGYCKRMSRMNIHVIASDLKAILDPEAKF
jgi:hypothetical protein